MNKITAYSVKKLLKLVKLNESTISMVLGIIVVIIVGSLVLKYLKSDKGSIPEELLSGTNSIESSEKVHTVQKNETVWSIAVNYYGDGFKWVDIATENKIENASVIEIGQKLTISKVPTISQNKSDAITSDNYEVIKGDSLWSIAIRAYGDGYQWVKIARENKIVNPNIIHTGNILTLSR